MNNDQVKKLKLHIQQWIAVLEKLLQESIESHHIKETSVVDAQVVQNEKQSLYYPEKTLNGWIPKMQAFAKNATLKSPMLD